MKGKTEGTEETEGLEGPHFAKASRGKQEELKKDKLVLIDGNAILHRAYHALPPLTTRNGELVNAVYGFSSMLLRILDELKPKYIAVSFDTGKVTFRNEEFVGYKANRPKMDEELVGQIDKVYKVVETFNIPIYTADGFEADDVLATIAKQAIKLKDQKSNIKTIEVIEVIIVTGDKDLMQLVNDEVKLYMPTKGLSEGQIVGEDEVKQKMGVAPDKIVDYKGLVGDPSDNYPGVPGIGPKTAIELLKKFGSIEEIYRVIGNIRSIRDIGSETIVKKLVEGKESALLSKKLATIVDNAPVNLEIENCLTKDFDKEKVASMFRDLGFRSLVARVEKGNGGETGNKGKMEPKKNENQQSLF